MSQDETQPVPRQAQNVSGKLCETQNNVLESKSCCWLLSAFTFPFIKVTATGVMWVHAKSLQSSPAPTLWTRACQASLWNSPGKNTGVGCHGFLQGIFPTQGSEPVSLRSSAGGFFTTRAAWEDPWELTSLYFWAGSPSHFRQQTSFGEADLVT